VKKFSEIENFFDFLQKNIEIALNSTLFLQFFI